MTQNQLAYQRNLIAQQEAATNAAKLAETHRSNVAQEGLANRRNAAEYGVNRYALTDAQQNSEVWTNQRSVWDTVKSVFQNLGSILRFKL